VVRFAPLPVKELLALLMLTALVTLVRAVIEVMSEFAPLTAALRLERAPEAELAPVPPWATDNAVVRPDREVMSEFAPLAAVPRFVRAPEAVVAPVPPLATATVPVTLAALPVMLSSVKARFLVVVPL